MDDRYRVTQPDEGLSGLRRITVDLDIYFGRVSEVVAEYKAGHGETTDHDPIAVYVREMLATSGADLQSEKVSPGGGGAKTDCVEILNANRLIEDVVTALQRMVKERARLQAEPADRELRIVANREKMARVLAGIVAYGTGIIKKGGTITILAKLLPLKSSPGGKGGCALLQVGSNDVETNEPGRRPRRRAISKESARRAYSVIRSIIGEHHGAISVMRRPGKARFNIYLPILRGV